MKTAKRKYRSEIRDGQAAQTKSLVLEAAKQLFQREGFEGVTIKMLAQEAEVSMPTIYALFKSKRGVLQALIDAALPPEQFLVLVDEAMQEQSAVKHLQISAKMARQIYDAERELLDLMRGASVLSPELRELERERELRRFERQGQSVQRLIELRALAKGLTLQSARDILWVLTGRDMYRMFVVERGWTSAKYEKWLAELLVRSLLIPK